MNPAVERYARSQAGYTLIELVVASAIGLMVMTGLTSVVLTSWRANATATSRIEASGQIRNFQLEAYDDFALSSPPAIPSDCAAPLSQSNQCSSPIVLQGSRASNAAAPSISSYQVSYTWDSVGQLLERQTQFGTNPPVQFDAAIGVTAFSWYLDGSGSHQTVVVTISITVQTVQPESYTQTQTLRFYPRVNP